MMKLLSRTAPLLFTCLAFLMGCSAVPASISVTGLPASVPEGTAIPVAVSALDRSGTVLPTVDVTWTVTPEGGASRAGNVVSFPKEGTVEFLWTAGEVSKRQQVVVLSPLIGEYERESQPSKGMRMRFRTLGGRVVAEITQPPEISDESTKWISDTFFASVKAPAAEKLKYARKVLECRAERWAVGLRKLDDVRRMETGTWEAQSLTVTTSGAYIPGKPCPKEGAPSYMTTTIEREPDGVLVFAMTTSADEKMGAKQRWKPVP